MPIQKKPFYRRILEFRLFFVVNAVLLVLLLVSFGREFVRNQEIQHDIAQLQQQAASLEAKRLEIAQLNEAFQTESFIEREARLKLGLKKPGEEVVVVQGDGEKIGDTGTGTEGTPLRQGSGGQAGEITGETQETNGDGRPIANPTKWWYYFFDRERLVTI